MRVIPSALSNRAVLAIALLLVTSASTIVDASAITYEYGGVITQTDSQTNLAVGTRFSGTFTYDPKDIAQNVGFEGSQNYGLGQVPGFSTPGMSAIEKMTLSIGNSTIASLQGQLGVGIYEPELGSIRDASGATLHQTYLNINSSVTNDDPYQLGLSLSNPGRTVYANLNLPTTINLSDFTSSTFSATFLGPGNVNDPTILPSFSGTLDTLDAIPTPEPSAMIVLGVGVAAWLARSRFRATRKVC